MPDVPPQDSADSPYEFAPKPQPEALIPAARSVPARAEPAAPEALPYPERTCPHCGFRIVSKPVRNRCPDCAAPFDDLASDLLQFSDKPWLRSLATGSLVLAASIPLQILGCAIGYAGIAGGNFVHLFAALITAIGVWMSTAREPLATPSRTLFVLPARLAALVVIILWILPTFMEQFDNSHIFTLALLLVMGLQIVLIAARLKFLTHRIPNDSLGSHLLNTAILTAGICAVLGALHVLNLINQFNLMLSFFCAFPMIGIMALIPLWGAWCLIRLALEFRNSAAAGDAIIARQAQRAQQAAQPKTRLPK